MPTPAPIQKQVRTHDTEKRTTAVLYRAGTLNEEKRTVEFVMATDAPADFSGYFEVLGLDDGELRTKRLDDGIVPLLDSHPQAQWKDQTIDDQLGAVIEWRKENNQIIGVLLFAEDERSERAFQKVKSGILKTGSIGYFVYKHKNVSGPEDKKLTYRAVDWEIVEFSLVSIPRDPNAQARSQTSEKIQTIILNEPENTQERTAKMPPDNKVEPKTFTPDEVETQKREAAKAETQRVLDIQAASRSAGVDEAFTNDLITKGVSFADASMQILKRMGEKAKTEGNPLPAIDVDHKAEGTKREARIKAMASALVFRADSKNNQLPDDAREFANLRLMDFARKSLHMQGRDTSFMGDEAVIRSAFQTTSEFPEITQMAVNMSVKRGWDSVSNNYEHLITHTNRTNFLEGGSVSLSDAPQFKKLGEHGEIEKGYFDESVEKYKIETMAVEVGLSRQALYNDQVGIFGKVPFSLGASGARSVKELVWNIFIKNQKMYSDKVALFHANHKNLNAATAKLDKAALAAMVLGLRKQMSPKEKIMNYNPGYLIVSAELEEAGRSLIATINPNAVENVNVFKDTLKGLIVEGTLGAKDFYLSGRSEEVDLIELAWLNGNRGVQITEKEVNGTGITWQALLDVGGAPMDFRGFQKGAVT